MESHAVGRPALKGEVCHDLSTADDVKLVNILTINEKTKRLLEDYINRAIGPFTELAEYQSIYILC